VSENKKAGNKRESDRELSAPTKAEKSSKGHAPPELFDSSKTIPGTWSRAAYINVFCAIRAQLVVCRLHERIC
jgi:hypothetical protein